MFAMDSYIPPQMTVAIELEAPYIFDERIADVTGDQINDLIYLVGDKEDSNAIYQQNLQLFIVNGATDETIKQPLNMEGYGSKLFIGDFTQNAVSDVLVSVDSGGSGGLGFYKMYTFINDEPCKLFDYEVFNSLYNWEVKLLDNYRVEVKNSTNDQVYYLDIANKSKDLIERHYHDDGTVKGDASGDVYPLSGLYPIKVHDNADNFNLMTTQQISAVPRVDGLGLINVYLKFENNQFIPYEIVVGEYHFTK
ncbi:MAG TPA: hypothetical protein DCY20_08950 [Firmicutes bacterium]|nr:hypothetical protein [Bacillota bacterium]